MLNLKNSNTIGYKDINLKEFQMNLDSNEEFKIYIYQTNCSACKEIKPILDQVVKEEKIKLFAIDMEIKGNLNREFLKERKITKTPTFLHYKNGKEINRLEGIQSKEELKEMLVETKDKK